MEYVLDVSKWRCGGEFHWSDESDEVRHILGEGYTALLNDEGYMCCLGQFARQVKSEDHMEDLGEPCEFADAIQEVYDAAFVELEDELFYNTDLAEILMNINDNGLLTTEEKIQQIREALEQRGHTLKVINENPS